MLGKLLKLLKFPNTLRREKIPSSIRRILADADVAEQFVAFMNSNSQKALLRAADGSLYVASIDDGSEQAPDNNLDCG